MKKNLSEYEQRSWQLVILCLIAYTTVYIGRKNLSVCLPDMISDGIISKEFGGTVGTCFLVCYAAGQLINGRLGDIIHPRFMVPFGLMSAGIMNILMGTVSKGVLFAIFWGICGISCSMLWSPIIRAVSSWTTEEIRFSAAASLSATIPSGTILCYLICAAAMKFFGWRAAFITCGTVLCIASVALLLGYGRLRDHMTVETVKKEAEVSQKEAPDKSAKIKVLGLGLIFAASVIVFNGMLKDGLDLWIPTVLNDKFIPSASIVSLICTILPVLNVFGAYAAKLIFTKLKIDELATTGVMFGISTAALAVFTVILKFIPSKAPGSVIGFGDCVLAVLVTLLLAVSSASMLGANTMLLTYIPLHYSKIGKASTVTGTLNCFSYAAAAASSVLVGFISGELGWESVFVLFIIASAAGGLICLFTHKIMKRDTDKLN